MQAQTLPLKIFKVTLSTSPNGMTMYKTIEAEAYVIDNILHTMIFYKDSYSKKITEINMNHLICVEEVEDVRELWKL